MFVNSKIEHSARKNLFDRTALNYANTWIPHQPRLRRLFRPEEKVYTSAATTQIPSAVRRDLGDFAAVHHDADELVRPCASVI